MKRLDLYIRSPPVFLFRKKSAFLYSLRYVPAHAVFSHGFFLFGLSSIFNIYPKTITIVIFVFNYFCQFYFYYTNLHKRGILCRFKEVWPTVSQSTSITAVKYWLLEWYQDLFSLHSYEQAIQQSIAIHSSCTCAHYTPFLCEFTSLPCTMP